MAEEFTKEQQERLGIPKAEYVAKREAAKERARAFVAQPRVRSYLDRSFARRHEAEFRLDDDGCPPLPDDFKPTYGGSGEHLRSNYAAGCR